MRVITDENVLAYFPLGIEPLAQNLQPLLRKLAAVLAPRLWHVGLLNLLPLAVRKDAMSEASASARLAQWPRLLPTQQRAVLCEGDRCVCLPGPTIQCRIRPM